MKFLKLLSLLLLSTNTIQIYSCFDCCTNESAYIKPSCKQNLDRNEEQLPSNTQTYEIVEKKESLLKTDHPIQLQAEAKTIITFPLENNEESKESAPHFIEEINNTKENFYYSPTPEKISPNSKNIPSSQTTSTNSIQLGNNMSDDSSQAAFNTSLHKLHPAEQAIVFNQIRLSISQDSFYNNSHDKNVAKNNEFYTTHQAKYNNNNNNDDDDPNSPQNSQPSTIDSIVAKAGWPTAIFQTDSNSTSNKIGQKAKSSSGAIYSISENDNSSVEKS